MPRHFYAIHRPYGLAAINANGNRANEVHRFASLAELEAFVNDDPDHREPIAATTYAARKAKRAAEHGWEWPQKVMD